MAALQDKSFPGSVIHRISLAVASGFASPAYGTPYGLMHLRGELSAEQYREACGFHLAYTDYLAAIDAKSLRTGALERGSQSAPVDADSARGRSQARREAIALTRYNALDLVVQRCGAAARRDWEAVVCAEVTPTYPMKVSVRAVAEALVRANRGRRKDARTDGRTRK